MWKICTSTMRLRCETGSHSWRSIREQATARRNHIPDLAAFFERPPPIASIPAISTSIGHCGGNDSPRESWKCPLSRADLYQP